MLAHYCILMLCLLLGVRASPAAQWYVAPQGAATNPGTGESPWDVASALNGRQEVRPGDAICLLGGTYRRRPKELFEVRLEGAQDAPIQVRPVPGQRARIDGGLSIQSPSAHVWIRDLEVFVSEPVPEEPVSAGSHPPDLNRPHGGLHMYGGRNCKYINLIIHHCNQGISCWKGEIDPEIYGCIIYENGWLGQDRGHGHCIYTQNDEGVKTISNCIMTCRYDGSYTMHAYGSERACVNNYLVTENICYGCGPFLIGGGRPSYGIRVLGNHLYGIDMRLGYTAPYNEDCEVRDNVIVNGRLEIVRYRNAVREGNLVLGANDDRPPGAKAVFLPNKYDSGRGHLVLCNWAEAPTVEVRAAGLRDDDRIELRDPKDPFGAPLLTATCQDGIVQLPIRSEFAVFLVKIDRR